MEVKQKNMSFAFSLAFFAIVTFLSMDMYLSALPTMAKSLGLTVDSAQYTITAWFLGSASLQLIVGPLADVYGRKIFFISGIVLFFISSLVIAVSSDYVTILVARYFQGITVCTTMVAGLSTIHSIFDGKHAVGVVSTLMTITILAPALGPVLGAFIVKSYSWQAIFFVLAYASVLGFLLNIIFMPNTNDKGSSLKMSAIFTNYRSIVCNGSFMKFLSINCLLTSAFFIWVVESPFLIISGLNRGEVYYGLVQIPIFGAFIVGGQLTRYFINYYPVANVVKVGMVLAALGASLFLLTSCFYAPDYCWVSAMTLFSTGASMTFGALNRYTIISSNMPMGSKVAVNSSLTSFCGVLSSLLVSAINNMTFFNIALPIFIVTVIAVALFFKSDLPDVESV